MNVFMIGGTGLLGCEAAKQLIAHGHKVKTVALPPLPQGAPIPEEMEIIFQDINKATDEEVMELLKDQDVFIFAAGVDERVEFPAPVEDYYDKFNCAPLRRILPMCKKAGLKNAVVLGSYFAWLSKKYPEKGFQKRNKYFAARLQQEEVCRSMCDENFSVKVLELPYIFGTQPGRRPVWTILIEQIKMMDNWGFTMYPKGGTAMLTCRQVGEVICGAAEREVPGFEAFPIGMYNYKWDKFLKIVYNARGMGADRKIIGVPPIVMKMGMVKVNNDYKKRGIDSGMDPFNLPDIMDIDIFFSDKYARELGATDDDIVAAIDDSIKVSVAAYEGKVELIGMRGE